MKITDKKFSRTAQVEQESASRVDKGSVRQAMRGSWDRLAGAPPVTRQDPPGAGYPVAGEGLDGTGQPKLALPEGHPDRSNAASKKAQQEAPSMQEMRQRLAEEKCPLCAEHTRGWSVFHSPECAQRAKEMGLDFSKTSKKAQQNPMEEPSAPAVEEPGMPGQKPPVAPGPNGQAPGAGMPGQPPAAVPKKNPVYTQESWRSDGGFSREVEADSVDDLVRLHRELNQLGLSHQQPPQGAQPQQQPQPGMEQQGQEWSGMDTTPISAGMKQLAQMNMGMEADWFSDMSPEQQQQYKKDHPGSQKSQEGGPGAEDEQPAEVAPEAPPAQPEAPQGVQTSFADPPKSESHRQIRDDYERLGLEGAIKANQDRYHQFMGGGGFGTSREELKQFMAESSEASKLLKAEVAKRGVENLNKLNEQVQAAVKSPGQDTEQFKADVAKLPERVWDEVKKAAETNDTKWGAVILAIGEEARPKKKAPFQRRRRYNAEEGNEFDYAPKKKQPEGAPPVGAQVDTGVSMTAEPEDYKPYSDPMSAGPENLKCQQCSSKFPNPGPDSVWQCPQCGSEDVSSLFGAHSRRVYAAYAAWLSKSAETEPQVFTNDPGSKCWKCDAPATWEGEGSYFCDSHKSYAEQTSDRDTDWRKLATMEEDNLERAEWGEDEKPLNSPVAPANRMPEDELMAESEWGGTEQKEDLHSNPDGKSAFRAIANKYAQMDLDPEDVECVDCGEQESQRLAICESCGDTVCMSGCPMPHDQYCQGSKKPFHEWYFNRPGMPASQPEQPVEEVTGRMTAQDMEDPDLDPSDYYQEQQDQGPYDNGKRTCRRCGSDFKASGEMSGCPKCGSYDVYTASRKTAQPKDMPPAAAGMQFETSNERSEGDRVVFDVSWSPEDVTNLSEESIKQLVKSHVGTDISNRKSTDQEGTKNYGTIADPTIEEFDGDAGLATVSFMSSEQASPQNSAAEATE